MAHTTAHKKATQVIPAVQLPVGAVPSPQSGASKDTLAKMKLMVATPDLPTGTKLTPQLQQAQTPELMTTGGVSTTAPTAAIPTATASQAAAAVPSAAQTVADPATMTAAQYAATTVGAAPTMAAAQGQVTAPMTAQQGTIASDATVRGQLAGLQQQVQSAVATGQDLPAWALGAQKLVEANMAKRGMGASSMYAEALAQGVMQSAVPIAAADAQTYKEMIFQNLNNRQQAAVTNTAAYLQMDMSNLSNNQQANLQNLAARQATLFTDQSAQNAASQFNATSQNQVEEFFTNLSTQVETNNAQRADAMNTFESAEKNKIAALNANNETEVSRANAEREAAINQFNSSLTDNREKFNVENQRVIDQSNTQWRRQINTANTAATNAANQTNAQNLLNVSNFALSSMWQQWRDEATWTNEAAQNGLNRAHNIAMAILERQTEFDLLDKANGDKIFDLIGKFISGVWN